MPLSAITIRSLPLPAPSPDPPEHLRYHLYLAHRPPSLMIGHHRHRDRPPLVCDGHDHRLEPVMEARFVHEEYDRLLPRQGANHAPGEIFAGFRHVDAGVGDETAQPGLHGVGDSQERQAARDLVEGAGFRLGDAKTERREDCGLRLGQVREHAFDLVGPVVQWHRLAHGRLLLRGFCSPQGWSAFARESTFSYTPSEKCKAVSNERGIVRTPAPRAALSSL